MGVVVPLLLFYFVTQATSLLSYVGLEKREQSVVCNICEMGSNTGTIQSEHEVSVPDGKEEAVKSDVAHKGNARDWKAKDTNILECNICDLRTSTEGIGSEADVPLLRGKEEAVEAATVSKGVTRNEKAKETQKLKCNICEIHRKETSRNTPANAEA
ncbi:hypothetical protein OESDEN_00281, partial [Oesophagostomum dentatum]